MSGKKRKIDGGAATSAGEPKCTRELQEEKILSKARPFIGNSLQKQKHDNSNTSQENQTSSIGPSTSKESPKKKKLANNKKKKKGKNVTPQISPALQKKRALDYLKSWHGKDEHWKYHKKRNAWLIRNMYKRVQVSDENFALLLEYLETFTEDVRDRVIMHAEGIIKDCDVMDELKSEIPEACIISYKRARQVLQLIV